LIAGAIVIAGATVNDGTLLKSGEAAKRDRVDRVLKMS